MREGGRTAKGLAGQLFCQWRHQPTAKLAKHTASEHPLDHSRICVARFCILFHRSYRSWLCPHRHHSTAHVPHGNLSLLSHLKKGATSREGDNSIHHRQGRSSGGDALPPPSPTRQFVHWPSLPPSHSVPFLTLPITVASLSLSPLPAMGRLHK